jgi:hypothetical protein
MHKEAGANKPLRLWLAPYSTSTTLTLEGGERHLRGGLCKKRGRDPQRDRNDSR